MLLWSWGWHKSHTVENLHFWFKKSLFDDVMQLFVYNLQWISAIYLHFQLFVYIFCNNVNSYSCLFPFQLFFYIFSYKFICLFTFSFFFLLIKQHFLNKKSAFLTVWYLTRNVVNWTLCFLTTNFKSFGAVQIVIRISFWNWHAIYLGGRPW